MVPWPSALSRTTLPWRISWVFTVEIGNSLSCSGSVRRQRLLRTRRDFYNKTGASVLMCVLPVRIMRLCCLCSTQLFCSPFSAGWSGGMSGRGSDLGSSGVTAGSLRPFSGPLSFGSTTEDLQGRRLVGCPLWPMYLQAHAVNTFKCHECNRYYRTSEIWSTVWSIHGFHRDRISRNK